VTLALERLLSRERLAWEALTTRRVRNVAFVRRKGVSVFFLSYISSELRRRGGRTLLTALGLGVGVGLVVAVTALSDGLDRAQDEILQPLTGLGTDMSVTRPLDLDNNGGGGGVAGLNLSKKEREQLDEENGRQELDITDLGEPGESFRRTEFLTTTQLSFPASEVGEIAQLDAVQQAAGSLTLSATTVSGKVPESTTGGFGSAGQSLNFDSVTVTGVDAAKASLAPVGPDQITEGRYLGRGDRRQAVLNVSYARRKDIGVGDRITLKGTKYTVVGLAESPLGGQASDAYIKLDQLQKASDRKGRVNTVQVRADDGDAVADVEEEIKRTFAGADVTTAADLADRVGGSLTDAKNLAAKLGSALTVVALIASFLIASLLTLNSVTKRIRELGTLKAIGWSQRLVVRQVSGESLLQSALGGVLGALIGIGGAAIINAIGPTLEATVAQQGGGGGEPFSANFGQGAITSGSTEVALEAPVDFGLIVLAISLALLGGLIAGSIGGLRAARLRPADALRHID
jgi:ABC-type antimicrobial peptide transport system permease subunit